MEKDRGVWDYFTAGEIHRKGKEYDERVQKISAKGDVKRVVKEGIRGGSYKVEELIFQVARVGLIIPFLRLIQNISRNFRRLPSIPPK